MSTPSRIICKKECKGCSHKRFNWPKSKFPFNCHFEREMPRMITSDPYCGSTFKEPEGKTLKPCKKLQKVEI